MKSLACQGERKTRRLEDLLKDPEDIQWGASWQGKYLTPSNTDMKCLVVAVQYIFYMVVSQNGGTQQPLVFPLTMIILGWRLGVPPFKKHPYTVDCTLLHIYQTRSIESSITSQAWQFSITNTSLVRRWKKLWMNHGKPARGKSEG